MRRKTSQKRRIKFLAMASLKYFLPYKKSDGTIRVKIKIHHNGFKREFSTGIYVLPTDLTRSGKIKSQNILDEIEAELKVYRTRISELGFRVNKMDIDQVMDYILTPIEDDIDFFKFADRLIEKMEKERRFGTARNYKSALSSLSNFLGKRILPMNQLTSRVLFDYADNLKSAQNRAFKNEKVKVGNRAVSLYTGIFKAILNKAKLEYNDDDIGVTPIRVNPFLKFKIPPEDIPKKKALSVADIKKIRDCSPESKRGRIAKDCFMLSFYLLGMNSVDLYNGVEVIDGRITYERAKTRTRRKDNAEISVKVEPEALELLKKYMENDKTQFHSLYSNALNFNKAINIGLKEISKHTGISNLMFYAARHSWATIAVNDLGIDKYVVHQALNHSDETMKVTDMYIKKDWTRIDEANRKILDYMIL